MAKNKDPEVKINLEFVESLLNNGADINIADVHGQTLLHEVRLPVVSGNDVHGDDVHGDDVHGDDVHGDDGHDDN
jgi:hypothetical protein